MRLCFCSFFCVCSFFSRYLPFHSIPFRLFSISLSQFTFSETWHLCFALPWGDVFLKCYMHHCLYVCLLWPAVCYAHHPYILWRSEGEHFTCWNNGHHLLSNGRQLVEVIDLIWFNLSSSKAYCNAVLWSFIYLFFYAIFFSLKFSYNYYYYYGFKRDHIS